uniref:MYND-type domain-containing protein n=1 Tax=Chromera velia CCMP2878 TaxID=1169474 RepID=A0A0G4G9I6_9ALVE|eukprot:Cvel_20870.t1-p1 / transcript=Cvel_20870.t1 / gene=Cvel_20870 / organism=Chromera_velia_CCMP2878 / gene_product=hypothetical protein / transcript_product=hypothetical protein / location=Cvel_scaffold1913:2223-6947(-) / protein_length=1132 / sequence_SO=supercontig / SO=protein_coding / is_pseudo=false
MPEVFKKPDTPASDPRAAPYGAKAKSASDTFPKVEVEEPFLIPDFALVGKEFEELRVSVGRIVTKKKQIQMILEEAERGASEEEVRFHKSRIKSIMAHALIKCSGLVEGLTKYSQTVKNCPRLLRALVSDLLIVDGFFPSILWLFCVKSDKVDCLFLNDGGAVVLAHLVVYCPRLRYLIWRCAAFQWGLKTYIRSTIKQAAAFFVNAKDSEGLDPALLLVEVLKKLAGPQCPGPEIWTERPSAMPFSIDRESVEALNACASPGASEQDRASLIFAGTFADLWRSVQSSHAKKSDHNQVSIWGLWWRVCATFGMRAEVRRAERLAFASAESAREGLSLYSCVVQEKFARQDKLSGPPSTEVLRRRKRFVSFAKAVEMCLQNREVERLVAQEKVKALRVFRQILKGLAEVNEALKDQENEWDKVESEENERSAHFLALLSLSLEFQMSRSQKRSLRKDSVRSLAEEQIQKILDGSNAKEKELFNRPLRSLSSFLDDQILREEATEVAGEMSAPLQSSRDRKDQQQPSSSSTSPPLPSPAPTPVTSSQDPQPSATTFFSLMSRQQLKRLTPFPCDNCGKESTGAMNCAGCQLIMYCSKACQKAHWSGRPGKTQASTSAPEPAPSASSHSHPVECPLSRGAHRHRCTLLRDQVLRLLVSDSFTVTETGGDGSLTSAADTQARTQNGPAAVSQCGAGSGDPQQGSGEAKRRNPDDKAKTPVEEEIVRPTSSNLSSVRPQSCSFNEVARGQTQTMLAGSAPSGWYLPEVSYDIGIVQPISWTDVKDADTVKPLTGVRDVCNAESPAEFLNSPKTVAVSVGELNMSVRDLNNTRSLTLSSVEDGWMIDHVTAWKHLVDSSSVQVKDLPEIVRPPLSPRADLEKPPAFMRGMSWRTCGRIDVSMRELDFAVRELEDVKPLPFTHFLLKERRKEERVATVTMREVPDGYSSIIDASVSEGFVRTDGETFTFQVEADAPVHVVHVGPKKPGFTTYVKNAITWDTPFSGDLKTNTDHLPVPNSGTPFRLDSYGVKPSLFADRGDRVSPALDFPRLMPPLVKPPSDPPVERYSQSSLQWLQELLRKEQQKQPPESSNVASGMGRDSRPSNVSAASVVSGCCNSKLPAGKGAGTSSEKEPDSRKE